MKNLIILLALLLPVWAQTPLRPELSLNAYEFIQGDALEVEGRGLEPDATYELLLTSPDGEELTDDLSSDENGELEYTTPLNETGNWQIALSGEEVNAQFRFEVLPADAATADDIADSPADREAGTADVDDETTDLTPPGLGNDAQSNLDETPLGEEATAQNASPDGLRDETALVQPDASPTDPLTEEADASQTLGDVAAQSDLGTQNTSDNAAEPNASDPTSDADSGTQADSLTDTEVPESFTTGIENVFSGVARVGWYTVGAMLLAMLALHVTLLFKYWIPQSVIHRRRAAQRGTASGPWARLLAIRHYSFTEKLVLVIMFAVTLLLAALAGWNNPSQPFETWQDAVASTFRNPWVGLIADKPDGFSEILWIGLIILFLAWLVFTVFWLFIPRPRLSKNAPRSALYNVFSVLVPGSGLADEMWGLLLIVPWAIVTLDTLSNLFNWGIGIPALRLGSDYILLGLIYLINTVAVVVEFSSYRRRMEKLRAANPELAEEFGLAR